ncbi:MAG TPA: polysaccharide biosynthesis/export family protein [Pirellulales bacterium]|nr:polysaccharide biosynthesis/export family protein [Pirellulales bacterium]
MPALRLFDSRSLFALSVAAALALGGCAGPTGSFTLFPTGDFLLDSTKELRQPVPAQAVAPRELDKTVIAAYVIQPGDVLLVEPIALDSPLRFPADQTVLPDGTIDLGRFGRLVVAGKTLEQIETDVHAAVKAIEKDAGAVNVRLVDPQSAVYYVLGEVTSPGSYPFVGRETVLDAILAAGGLTDKASPCNIILSRPGTPCGCRTVIPICYKHIVQQGDTTTNYQVMPGDRIYVATRTLWESLNPCANRLDCPLCRGKQCPCPGTCAVGTSPSTTYALPVAAAPAGAAVETSPPPAMGKEIVIDDRAVDAASPRLAKPVVSDPFANPFGD